MSITDKTGRNLRKGQLVDLMMSGMFTGDVVGILESRITLNGQPPSPPMVLVRVMVRLPVQHNMCDNVYVVKPPPDSKEDSDMKDIVPFARPEG